MRNVLAVTICLAMLGVAFTACNKDKVKKEVFKGYAQKGPFVVGSSITISELDAKLTQTGKTYFTIIPDNSGSFELTDIELVSNYVELKADGFYFQEVGGAVSEAQITLYALADIADVSSANVNVLTHLEKPRVEYLVKQKKKTFSEAKQQAQKEVLAIFGFSQPKTSSEALNLTDNAMLIAISCILQGNNGITGNLTELMANIAADIKTDGKLDNMTLGTKLINNAHIISLSLDKIRENIETKYAELGLNVTIPNFENYVQSFANSKLYSQTVLIDYPAKGLYGDNILSDAVTSVKRGQNYSMCVNLPAAGGSDVLIYIICAKESDFYFLCDKEVVNWRLGQHIYYQGNDFCYGFFAGSIGKSQHDMLIQILGKEEYITIEYRERTLFDYPAIPTKTKRLRVLD